MTSWGNTVNCMRESHATVVRRTADLMRVAIFTGHMSQQLPQEFDLQRIYGVGRNIIRAALDTLRRDGLIERHQGTGTFVIGQRYLHRVDRPSGFTGGDEGLDVRRELLALALTPAIPVVSAMLEIDEGEASVLMVERLTVVGDTPTSLWTSYLHPWLAPAIESLGVQEGIRTRVAEFVGSEIREVVSTMTAALAPPSVAEALRVPNGAPTIRQERVSHLKNGLVAEFSIGWSRGDRFTLRTIRS